MDSMIKRVKSFIKNPRRSYNVAIVEINRRYPNLISDKMCLKAQFYLRFGYVLNLENPRTFNEKLQWLKLYNRRIEYTKMVDKYEAKKYAASIIGEKYIIPTIGVWERAEDIEWDAMPDKFVMKCTHDSGCVVICRDRSVFNKEEATNTLQQGLKRNYYLLWREWPYKGVPHRIIAEKYLEPDNQTNDLSDYKFSCFDGKVTDVMVCYGRSSGNTEFYFFDRDWNLLPLNLRGKNAPKGFTLPKPTCIDEMFEIASKLSKGLPYARVDLYAVNGHPYFGEITFFPMGGYDDNLLRETDIYYGTLIDLPNR